MSWTRHGYGLEKTPPAAFSQMTRRYQRHASGYSFESFVHRVFSTLRKRRGDFKASRYISNEPKHPKGLSKSERRAVLTLLLHIPPSRRRRPRLSSSRRVFLVSTSKSSLQFSVYSTSALVVFHHASSLLSIVRGSCALVLWVGRHGSS